MSLLDEAEKVAGYLRNFHWERYGDTPSESEPRRLRLERRLNQLWEELVPQLASLPGPAVREVALTLRTQGDPGSLTAAALQALERY